jgi:hypothetical protein
MADDNTTEITDDSGDSGPIKQLRAAEKAAREKAAEYKALLMEGAYNQMGLDSEMGLGKAIAKEYDGAPTADALAEYAKAEYGYEKPVGEINPQAVQITAETARLDQASQGAGSVPDTNMQDALAKAEAEGNYDLTMALKGQTVANQLMNPRR